jgi:hypothetical protein
MESIRSRLPQAGPYKLVKRFKEEILEATVVKEVLMG